MLIGNNGNLRIQVRVHTKEMVGSPNQEALLYNNSQAPQKDRLL